MRRAALPMLLTLIAFAVESTPAAAAGCETGTATYADTGAEQCYTVPAGITGIHVVAIGAPGAGFPGVIAPGGFGASVTADFSVSPGETLYVEVGGAPTGSTGGFNGGGTATAGDAGGGGGASDIRTCSMTALTCPGASPTLASRLLIAGGGGGGGSIASVPAGSGGSSFGVAPQAGGDGTDFAVDAAGGKGGQPGSTGAGGAHGAGGAGTVPAGGDGADGQLGVGGDGGGGCCGGGGGGGGYYGGGGGGGGGRNNTGNAGGGGGGGAGSSFVDPAGTGSSIGGDTSGTPSVTITPIATPLPPMATTAPASELAPTQATLNGVVNPEGLSTAYQFEYVDAADYAPAAPDPYVAGTSSPPQSAGSGDENALVQYTATGLSPGTTYHYRLVASNTSGTTDGVDRVFETPSLPQPSADISLTQSADPAPVRVGHYLKYVLFVHNGGPSDAGGVTLIDPLPGGARLQAVYAPHGACHGKPTVICDLGTLTAHGATKVTIVVRAVRRGALVNTATATADEPDPHSADNSATTSVRVTRAHHKA